MDEVHGSPPLDPGVSGTLTEETLSLLMKAQEIASAETGGDLSDEDQALLEKAMESVSDEIESSLSEEERALLIKTMEVISAKHGGNEEHGVPPGCSILTLVLDCCPSQRNRLDKIMKCANNVLNCLIGDRKKALEQMMATDEWKAINAGLEELKPKIKAIQKVKEEERTDEQAQQLAKLLRDRAALHCRQTSLKEEWGFTKYGFQHCIIPYRTHYSNLITANVGQKLADQAWAKFSAFFRGKSDCIKFSSWKQFFSIEAKSNKRDIVFMDGYVQFRVDRKRRRTGESVHSRWRKNHPIEKESGLEQEAAQQGASSDKAETGKECKKKSKCPFDPADGMIIPVRIAKPKLRLDPKTNKWILKDSSSSLYEREFLTHRVKYCRILRKHFRHGWKYFIQLVMEGKAPVKRNPKTGEPLHPLGKGKVGIDPSTRTVAVVAEVRAMLAELAPGIRQTNKIVQALQRALDRSRRAMNPQMFDEKGQIIPINLLPDEYKKNGKRLWKNSRNYRRLEQMLRGAWRELRESRLMKHQQLANLIVQLGDDFYYEKMNWAGLAKKAKKDARKKEEKARKEEEKALKAATKKKSDPSATDSAPEQKRARRRRRFGRSIEGKAPGTFERCLIRAIEKRGGHFHYILTAKCKASQFNHATGEYIKPSLSDRIKIIAEHKVQRDLYSAFLIQHVTKTLDSYNLDDLKRDFDHFLTMHDAEISRLIAMEKSGVRFPSGIELKEFYPAA